MNTKDRISIYLFKVPSIAILMLLFNKLIKLQFEFSSDWNMAISAVISTLIVEKLYSMYKK